MQMQLKTELKTKNYALKNYIVLIVEHRHTVNCRL